MTDNQIHRLIDLVEEIRDLERMIRLHESADVNDSTMLFQYQKKQTKLISHLIKDLSSPTVRSPAAFSILKDLLESFYPNRKGGRLKREDKVKAQKLEKLRLAVLQ